MEAIFQDDALIHIKKTLDLPFLNYPLCFALSHLYEHFLQPRFFVIFTGPLPQLTKGGYGLWYTTESTHPLLHLMVPLHPLSPGKGQKRVRLT